jgi:TetR/AcrR family transcriptional regulator, fatty acid biosynthesis regulator
MLNPDNEKRRSRRLDPGVRKHMILDKAAVVVATEGVSAVTMDRIGREVGVSKPLVYAYFPNVTTLLQELLLRDQRRLWDLQTIAVSDAKDFDELIRLTTQTYLRHVEKTGIHIQRLMGEPSVAVVIQEQDRHRRQRVVDFLTKETVHAFNIPRDVANMVIELSMGMTGTAGEMVSRGAASRKKIEEMLIRLYRGNFEVLREQYGKSQRSDDQRPVTPSVRHRPELPPL